MTGRWDIVAGALSSDAARVQARAGKWRIDPARSYVDVPALLAGEAGRGDAVMIATPPLLKPVLPLVSMFCARSR